MLKRFQALNLQPKTFKIGHENNNCLHGRNSKNNIRENVTENTYN